VSIIHIEFHNENTINLRTQFRIMPNEYAEAKCCQFVPEAHDRYSVTSYSYDAISSQGLDEI